MSDFAQLLKAVVDVDEHDAAGCSVLSEALVDQLRTWGPGRIERLRSTAIAERRQHGDEDPESTVDSLLNGNLSQANKWSLPTALGPPPPASLPVDQFPSVLRAHVDSVAGSTQTHSDVASILALLSVSAPLAGKAVVRVREGYSEPLNIYGAVVLPPGTRKSAVFRHMVAPIEQYEAKEVEELKDARAAALERRAVAEQKLTAVRKAVAVDRKSLDDLESARRSVEEIQVPRARRIIASDITSERLAQLMFENNGVISILSPEGDPFSIFGGRYSGGVPVLDHLKRAWTGSESIRDDRIGREGTYIRRPALTLGLALQPGFLEGLDLKAFRGEGLFGRVLWVVPDDLVGYRKTGDDVPPLDRHSSQNYARLLQRLLESTPDDVDSDGSWVPHELCLSAEARASLYAWDGKVEGMLRPGGSLGTMKDWGGKLVGNTVRLAGLLHIAEIAEAEGRVDWDREVSASAMSTAIACAEVLITHAHVLFDSLEATNELSTARYVLRRLREFPDDEPPTVRQLFEKVKGRNGTRSVKGLGDVLEFLEESGDIRRAAQEGSGQGRPPGPVILLNPLSQGSQNSQKPTSATFANKNTVLEAQ